MTYQSPNNTCMQAHSRTEGVLDYNEQEKRVNLGASVRGKPTAIVNCHEAACISVCSTCVSSAARSACVPAKRPCYNFALVSPTRIPRMEVRPPIRRIAVTVAQAKSDSNFLHWAFFMSLPKPSSILFRDSFGEKDRCKTAHNGFT